MSKICIMCGADVAQTKRVKDELGRYYCSACYEQGLRKKRAAQTGASDAAGGAHTGNAAHASAGVSTASRPEASAPLVAQLSAPAPAEDEYELKEAPAPRQAPKAACGVCKRVLPEARVRFVDGAFVCLDCQPLAAPPAVTPEYASGKKRKAAIGEDDANSPGPIRTFMATLPGIFVTASATLMLTWVAFTLAILLTFGPGDGSFLFAVLLGFAATVYSVVLASLLLLSMFLVDRMLGGVGFGTVSDVIWQSMLLVVANNLYGLFALESETLSMLSYVIQPIFWLGGFMLIFGIDFFEAVVLSFVNWIVNWMAAIAIGAILLSAANRSAGSALPPGGPPAGGAPVVVPAGVEGAKPLPELPGE